MLAFLLSKTGLALIAILAVMGVIAVQASLLNRANHEIVGLKASRDAAQERVKASEVLRATEYATAKTALTDAEAACGERVKKALGSGAVIRTIVGRPVHVDPTTHCPDRSVVSADELRRSLQP